jgi:hypothetical protein
MPKNSNTDPKPQCVQTDVSVSAFLNGKAKQDFIKWYDKNYISVERFLKDYDPEQLFKSLHEPFKPTLIVEWLDSIGMFIDCGYYAKGKMCSGIESEKFSFISTGTKHETRREAIISAIQKANELYNAKVVEAEH